MSCNFQLNCRSSPGIPALLFHDSLEHLIVVVEFGQCVYLVPTAKCTIAGVAAAIEYSPYSGVHQGHCTPVKKISLLENIPEYLICKLLISESRRPDPDSANIKMLLSDYYHPQSGTRTKDFDPRPFHKGVFPPPPTPPRGPILPNTVVSNIGSWVH